MDDLLLNPTTRNAIAKIALIKPHAIMLSGPAGSGKSYTAERLAEELLQISTNALYDYPYFFRLQPTGESIGIDSIRNLHGFLQLRTTGKANVLRRVAIINDAHLMTKEAQNSLLKVLEEPPQDTTIILTAQPTQNILPTVYSRVQHINIKPPDLQDTLDYFGVVANKKDIEKAYALSDGYVGILYGFVQKDNSNPLLTAIEDAKNLLKLPVFERLLQVELYAKDKARLVHLLTALKQIAKSGIKQSASSNNHTATKRWHKILGSVHTAQKLTMQNANPKLLVTNLLVNL